MTGHLAGAKARSPAIMLSGLFLALALCCTPCFAVGYTYLDTGEQPILVAQATGDTRYYPGDTFEMTVLLANKGTNTAMQIAPRLSPGAYNPTTALGVTVRPGAGDAPVTQKSLPVVAGDIASLGQVPVTIRGTVHRNASPGIYEIPLEVTYQYIYAIPMVGADYTTITPLYQEVEQTLPVTFQVLGEVRPAVISEHSENMVPGTQGYLVAEIANTGYAAGTDVTLRIVPADNTTFRMVDDSVYLGTFRPGDVVPLRVRVAVLQDTGAGSYPAVLEGEYRDSGGITRETEPVPIGITVLRGADMEAITRNLTIGTGGQETISVTFLNAGDTTAYDAKARIIGSHVLVPVLDSAVLGTVAPGENRTVQFVLSAASAIPGKHYLIDSEVKYRDELGALVLSDKMSFGVAVVQPSGLNAVISNPVIMIGIVGVLAILGYAALKVRSKKTGNP
jgi:hypothetical protein